MYWKVSMDVVRRERMSGSLERVLLLKAKETWRYYKAARQHLATLSAGAHTAPTELGANSVSTAVGEAGAAEKKVKRASPFRRSSLLGNVSSLNEEGTLPVVPDSVYWMDHDTCRVGFGPLGTVETVVTNSGHRASSWISKVQRDCQLSGNFIVGLGVEWRINFGRDDNETPLAYFQLSTDRHCLLFEIRRADFVPQSLGDFLADSRTTFVGLGIDEHFLKLLGCWNLTIGNRADIRYLAADRMSCMGMRGANLPKVVSRVLGVELKNSSSGERECLSMEQAKQERLLEEQVKCACADAFLAFHAGRRLLIP